MGSGLQRCLLGWLVLAPGCTRSRSEPAPYRMGFNFIRTLPEGELSDADGVIADITSVGGQGIRQIQGGDLSWFSVYQGGPYGQASSYDFTEADAYLLNGGQLVGVPTLFQLGPSVAARYFGEDCPEDGASESSYCRQPQTPEGEVLDLREDHIAAQVEGYLRVVAEHYADTEVRWFEVLNEPARYAHYDLGVSYEYNFEPERYVELLELTSRVFSEVEPDFHIVQGGMVYYDLQDSDGRQELWEDYFDQVLGKGGGNHLDALNFHFYGEVDDLAGHIDEVRSIAEKNFVGTLPLWMTEVGSSATLLGEERQATDLVKAFTIAFCGGVEVVNWHTHISSSDSTEEDWGGYGIRTAQGEAQASLYAFSGLAEAIGDHGTCEPLVERTNVTAYAFSGALHGQPAKTSIIAWSATDSGNLDLSALTRWQDVRTTQLVHDGEATPTEASTSEPVALTRTPVLLQSAAD